MNRKRDLAAGAFSAWLSETRCAHAEGSGVDVPCGDCVACCTSSYFIHVSPDETAALAAIPAELLFPAPGRPDGTLLLGYDSEGRCPMLRDGRCSIYEQRPRTCRIYDCRVFAAAGLDADRPAITARARRWEFDEASDDDRTRRAAAEPPRASSPNTPRSSRPGRSPTARPISPCSRSGSPTSSSSATNGRARLLWRRPRSRTLRRCSKRSRSRGGQPGLIRERPPHVPAASRERRKALRHRRSAQREAA